jgi:hypothetical protein
MKGRPRSASATSRGSRHEAFRSPADPLPIPFRSPANPLPIPFQSPVRVYPHTPRGIRTPLVERSPTEGRAPSSSLCRAASREPDVAPTLALRAVRPLPGDANVMGVRPDVQSSETPRWRRDQPCSSVRGSECCKMQVAAGGGGSRMLTDVDMAARATHPAFNGRGRAC